MSLQCYTCGEIITNPLAKKYCTHKCQKEACNRRWYVKYRNRILRKCKQYRERNKERISAYYKLWKQRNATTSKDSSPTPAPEREESN
jgi:hypothetical protein